jgi:UDP-2-acetamido-3-amino-2,3-dideoxy-glucuronate N-acetyltransferase
MSDKKPPFVHDKALCESTEVGAGTRVWAFAHVMKGAKIGEDCNVGGGAFVESGAVLGNRVIVKNAVLVWDKVTVEDDVFLGPNMVFTNDMNPRVAFKNTPDKFLPTRVKRGSSIGANATIVCGVTLGENCFVGAGTVVIRDVPAYAMVAGNPARRIGWMCACGQKLKGKQTPLTCTCGRSYTLADEKVGLVPRT